MNCLANPFNEVFNVEYNNPEYHYTLYYYDQAGNLVQTVPPEGVDVLEMNPTNFPGGRWEDGLKPEPNHRLKTKYRYNGLNQVVWQDSPDGGATNFYYDKIQRLRLSQNAKQDAAPAAGSGSTYAAGDFSYTKYDEQSRIIEVGQLEGYSFPTSDALKASCNDSDFPESTLTLSNITKTFYDDLTGSTPGNIIQENLRGRVVQTENENISTYYSYDVHGNVKSLAHLAPRFGMAKLDYAYDLVSGNVDQVVYQQGEEDEFRHRYLYDADNRLTHTFTSEKGGVWNQDARYFYYTHGPLARVEIGQDKVQGLDYFYTLQGWIKGVNFTGLAATIQDVEPGIDGSLTPLNNFEQNAEQNRLFGRDEMGYTLGYHENDYIPVESTMDVPPSFNDLWDGLNAEILKLNGEPGLYNGNIAAMTTYIPELGRLNNNTTQGLQSMAYQYDQLHRIIHSKSAEYNGNSWSFNNQFNSQYGYDANGNIDSLKRNAQGILVDDLTYSYPKVGINKTNNQLKDVSDGIVSNSGMNDLMTQQPGNYSYDEIGNLIKDDSEFIEDIEWTVYGKVKRVQYSAAGLSAGRNHISFSYDAAGNRLSKTIENADNETSWYMRDASGNIMAVYKSKLVPIDGLPNSPPVFAAAIYQEETPLYGSSRLGLRDYGSRYLRELDLDINSQPLYVEGEEQEPDLDFNLISGNFSSTRGNKFFELSNHLGNVLETVSDKLKGHWDGTTVGGAPPPIKFADYYEADVKSASDYYPFGWSMPGRKYQEGDYRFGFNGKENDQEWGSQVIQDYGFRIYNPSIAKFLSVDPLAPEYPELTPYQFASNSPISNIDLDGLERIFYRDVYVDEIVGIVRQRVGFAEDIYVTTYETVSLGMGQPDMITSRTFRNPYEEWVDYDKYHQDIAYRRSVELNKQKLAREFQAGSSSYLAARSNPLYGASLVTPLAELGDAGMAALDAYDGNYGQAALGFGLLLAPDVLGDVVSRAARNSSGTASYRGRTFNSFGTEVTNLQKVNNRFPINGKRYAGGRYSLDGDLGETYGGVDFSMDGFPDFSPFALQRRNKIIEIEVGLNGTSADISEANRKFKELYGEAAPTTHTFHHVEHTNKVILVPSDLHDAVKHTGGNATGKGG